MRAPLFLLAAALGATACSDGGSSLAPESRTIAPSASIEGAGIVGGVFTQTNGASGNAVLAFARAANGSLTPVGSYATGGLGIGGTTDPLTSQYALALSPNHRRLYVANAGSNDITVFTVQGGALTLTQRIATGGTTPVSIAAGERTVYVLDAGSKDVAGFTVDAQGTLTRVPSWTRALNANASGPAAVRLSRNGRVLAVTERASGTIDLFAVNPDGSLGQAVTSASSGAGPFGFDFTNTGRLAVSEAAGGSASSYVPRGDLTLETVTASAPLFNRAPCWLIVTPSGRFAYTANAGSGSLTGFAVAANGALSLLHTNGVTADVGAGNSPLDLDVSRDGRFLYVLKAGSGTIGALSIAKDGSLAAIGDVSVGTPRSGQQGVAAY